MATVTNESKSATITASSAITDSFLTTGAGNADFGSTRQQAQSFTAVGANIVQVDLNFKYVSGTAGDIICNLYATDGAGNPTGNSLGSVTISGITDTSFGYRTFIFTSPIPTTIGIEYAVALSSPTASAVTTYAPMISAGYTGNLMSTSTNSGSTWSNSSNGGWAIPYKVYTQSGFIGQSKNTATLTNQAKS